MMVHDPSRPESRFLPPSGRPSLLRVIAGAGIACCVALAACDGVSPPPPGHVANAVPPQAVNDGTLGLVRIRLTQEVESQGASAFGKWMADHGMQSTKASYLANELRKLGLTTILVGIPGDVIESAVRQCDETLKTHADTGPDAIKKMLDAFAPFGVTQAQIEKRIQSRIEAIRPAQFVQLDPDHDRPHRTLQRGVQRRARLWGDL